MFDKLKHSIKYYSYELPEIIRNNSKYLKKGQYVMDELGTFIYLKEDNSTRENKSFLNNTFARLERGKHNKFWKRVFIKLFNVSVPVHDDVKKFQASIMHLSPIKDEYKFFDVEKKLILTLYNDTEKMLKLYSDINFFGRFFDMPRIVEIDQEGLLVEEYIKNENYSIDEAFVNISRKYVVYFSYIKSQNDIEYKDYDAVYNCSLNDEFSKSLLRKVKELYCHSVPWVRLHGDLWSSNILSNSNRIYVIDWEGSKTYYFLFDFFMFIFNEMILIGRDDLLDNYFKGLYDYILCDYFAVFNLEFKKEYRKLYFIQFAHCFYLNRSMSEEDRRNNQIILKKVFEKYNVSI